MISMYCEKESGLMSDQQIDFEKKHSGEYYNFANECYDEGNNLLGEAMLSEITKIIIDAKIHDKESEEQAKKIMRLVFATRYEW